MLILKIFTSFHLLLAPSRSHILCLLLRCSNELTGNDWQQTRTKMTFTFSYCSWTSIHLELMCENILTWPLSHCTLFLPVSCKNSGGQHKERSTNSFQKSGCQTTSVFFVIYSKLSPPSYTPYYLWFIGIHAVLRSCIYSQCQK